MLQPGDAIGRYRIARVLGRGGMGVVYEARLLGPGGFQKRVALKVLTDGGEALAHEARLGGMLRHDNLVEVYALEQIEGIWVCAMELVPDGSLSDRLPLSQRGVIDAASQVARGLAHAHAEIGLVHLDLKPANLLVAGATVKIADLGISRAHGFVANKTRGTPKYMSPEAREGASVDARADVYALGVCMIELATGKPGRDPYAVPWLTAILQRCVAVDPNERFATMNALLSALSEVEATGEGLGGPASTPRSSQTSTTQVSETWTVDLETDLRPRTNLRPEADTYVGRRDVQDALVERLATPGLLTLKGTGGLGKTRLAKRVARTWHEREGGEAWFIDLTSARSELELVQIVANTLEVPLGRGEPSELVAQIGFSIRSRGAAVLVFDNLEQLTDHSHLIATWRDAAPAARLLVTSRVPLHLPGESVFNLAPLTQKEAVELLQARCQRRLEDTEDLRALAASLDGLPLALELVSGRLGMLSPEAVLKRMNQQLAMLKSRDRTLSPRQATMRGALDWSWELLDEDERAAIAQCSIFVDGFAIEDAEEIVVLPGPTWVLDAIESLVDRSLLAVREDGQIVMYQTTRSWASEHRGEDPALEERFLTHFASLGGRRLVRAMVTSASAERFHRIAGQRANLLSAFDLAMKHGHHTTAADILVACAAMFEFTGPYDLLIGRANQILEHEISGEARGDLLRALGIAIRRIGRSKDSVAPLREALEIAEAESDNWGLARTHSLLGIALRSLGDPEQARIHIDKSVSLYRDLGDPVGLSGALGARTSLLKQQGDVAGARAVAEEAILLVARVRHARAKGMAAMNLGVLLDDQGRLAEAQRCYDKALAGYRQVGDHLGEALVVSNLGVMYRGQGQLERARGLYERAATMYAEAGLQMNAALVQNNLGNLCLELGDVPGTRRLLREALDITESIGHRYYSGHIRGNLGLAELCAGDLMTARIWFDQALEASNQLGDEAFQGVWKSEIGRVLARQGRSEQALTQLDEAIALLEGRLPTEFARAWATRCEVTGVWAPHPTVEDFLEHGERPTDTARVWCSRAHCLAQAGRAEARDALQRATVLAEGLRFKDSPVDVALCRVERLLGDGSEGEGVRR